MEKNSPQIISAFLIKLLYSYRRYISPLLGNRCRFHPSCSHYAEEAIVQYGILRGSWAIINRLLHCHPFHPGGYDPVKTPK